MRRRLGWIAIGWLLALCAVALIAYGNPSKAATLDERTLAVAGQLRCPVCEGESVADSQADIARSIRALIRKDLQQGQSPDAIKAYLISRYPNISLAPSSSGIGSVAWLAPPLLLLSGIGLLVTMVADWRTRGRSVAGAPGSVYLERVRAEVAKEEVGVGD